MHKPDRTAAEEARAAMRAGRFEQARAAYAALIARGSLRPSDHLGYAGCLSKLKDSRAARRHMQRFYQQQPLGRAPRDLAAETSRLLVIRGLDKTKPTLGKLPDGTYKPKLRGGHFTLRYLLLDAAPARQRLTVVPSIRLKAEALPPHRLMLNTISDADVEAGSLRQLAEHLRAHPGTLVINAPEAVLQTTRDGNYARLKGLPNAQFPKTVRLTMNGATAESLQHQLDHHGFHLPVILRRVGSQTGRSTQRLDNAEDVARFCASGPRGAYYAIQYKPLLWQDSYFRKMRLFCIDGAAYPVVCHFDHVWNVHGGNRRSVMKTSPALMAEEQAFLKDWRGYIGAKAAAAVETVFARTPLDFFGMDFTVDTDGGVFIYELNASMRHSFDHAKTFPYKMPYDRQSSAAFEAMVCRKMQG